MNVQALRRTGSSEGRPARGGLVNAAIVAVTGAIIIGVVLLVNQPASASGVTSVSPNGPATGDPPIVGRQAPDFTAPGVNGSPVTLSAYRGHPVWLTFGASWCQPCRAENPDIEAAYDRAKGKGVVVVQVYMSEDKAAVADYTQRVGITYVRVPDPDERLAAQYRILGIPSHFFIDASGVLRKIKVGSLDPAAMDAALAEVGG